MSRRKEPVTVKRDQSEKEGERAKKKEKSKRKKGIKMNQEQIRDNFFLFVCVLILHSSYESEGKNA